MKIIIFHCGVRSRLARLSHHARKNGISSAAVKCIFIPFHSVNVFSLFHLVKFWIGKTILLSNEQIFKPKIFLEHVPFLEK